MFDDILGEWDKPTPQVPASVVEDARVLGAAEAKGAIVTVTYTVGSTTYTAKFEKGDGDNYTLISNTKNAAAARAMTRVAAPADPEVPTNVTDENAPKLTLVSGELVLVVKDQYGTPLFEGHMKMEGGEVTIINTNAHGYNCSIGTVAVNDEKKDIKNPEMENVTISFTNYLPVTIGENHYRLDATIKYAVQYIDGEKWSDVIARYKDCNHAEIGTTDADNIKLSFDKDIATDVLRAALDAYNRGHVGQEIPITDETLATLANQVSQIPFYLYDGGAAARAMTRRMEPGVKSDDLVVKNKNYYLLTNAPGGD